MNPFFSVIIPTYNRAHLLANTLRNLLHQDFADWELILVDDGSTDNTYTIVEQFKDPRIHYLYKENGERGAARNFGIDHANGMYLFFLDSDDAIKPEYLAYAHELIVASSPDCLHIPYLISDGKSEKPGPVLRKNVHRQLRNQNRFACQVIVKREILQDIRFSENRDFKIGEDWFFILRLLDKFEFVVGEKKLGVIVQHETRSMVTAPWQTVIQSRDIFLQELGRFLSHDKKLQANVNNELTNLAALHASISKEKKKALNLLIQSIIIRPSRIFRWRNMVIFKKLIFGR